MNAPDLLRHPANHWDRLRHEQNYVSAHQRPSCQGCAHVQRVAHTNGYVGLECGRGGFYVSSVGVCALHQPFANHPQAGKLAQQVQPIQAVERTL